MPFETFALGLAQDTLLELELTNLEDVLFGEAGLVAGDQTTLRVTQTHDAGTELDDLEGSELGDVSGAGDENLGLGVLEGDTTRDVTRVHVGDHLEAVVDETVTSGFGTSVGSTPCWALAGEDTNPLIAELLVGTEEETNLATSGSLCIVLVANIQLGMWIDVRYHQRERQYRHQCGGRVLA